MMQKIYEHHVYRVTLGLEVLRQVAWAVMAM